MPFWTGDTDLRQVVSSQVRRAFSLSRADLPRRPVGGSRLSPSADLHATAEYRRDVAGTLVQRVVQRAAERAKADDPKPARRTA
jgi:hypothetical protein